MNKNDKIMDQDPDLFLTEEERHRRLWLRHVLQTPMPLPRYKPTNKKKPNKPHGSHS